MSLHVRSTAVLLSIGSYVVRGASLNPAWDPDTMPSWNKTTDCEEWDEDYNPCTFPFFGLSSYSPDATHCHKLFSESFPDAYLAVHLFFLVSYSLLTLLYGYRVLLCLVDTKSMPQSAPFAFLVAKLQDPNYSRAPKPNKLKPGTTIVTMNVYDYCNCLMLATSVLQVILSCDVEGWSDLIPYKVHVTLGIMSQNIAVMTGIPITVNWMNLIHVWSNPFKNRNTLPPYGRLMRNTAFLTMWLVSFPMTFTALLLTRSCDNGCENGSLSCIGKIVFSLVLITIVLTSSTYAFRMYLVLKSDDKFNLKEFLFPWWVSSLSSSPSEEEGKVISTSLVSSSARGSSSSIRNSSSSIDDREGHDKEGDDLRQKVIWEQIRKIWKIVCVSVVVSIGVIYDNFSYCSGHYGSIKYESPPCSAADTVLSLKMMWFMLGGSVVFILLIPARQQKQSEAAKKVLVDRINHNVTSSAKRGEVALTLK